MSVLNIYDEMTVHMPEGFHQMDAEEMKNYFNDDSGNRQGIINPEKHTIIAFYQKRIGWLASKIINAKAMRVRLEVSVCRSNPGVKVSGEYDITAGGVPCSGFSYPYSVQGRNYVNSIAVIIKDRMSYTVNCTSAAEGAAAAEQEFKRLLENAAL